MAHWDSYDKARFDMTEWFRSHDYEDYVTLINRSDFGNLASFRDFVRIYHDGRPDGAKCSERVFLLLLFRWLKKKGHKVKIERGKKLTLQVEGLPVDKIYDYGVEIDGIRSLVQLKKNIDMVESDLFKAYLTRSCDPEGQKWRIYLLIWENRKTAGPEASYRVMANHAVKKGWLDDWWYMYPVEVDSDGMEGPVSESKFGKWQQNIVKALTGTS